MAPNSAWSFGKPSIAYLEVHIFSMYWLSTRLVPQACGKLSDFKEGLQIDDTSAVQLGMSRFVQFDVSRI